MARRLPWGASGTALPAGQEGGLSCTALSWGGLTPSVGGFAIQGAAEAAWSVQPGEEETEDRPHCRYNFLMREEEGQALIFPLW